ncbi:MAG TPA: hypothetical protein VLV15_13085, partial [Dongiaceae bacterium]|nr:hypothetical protein [Dongiaceae bacterium]
QRGQIPLRSRILRVLLDLFDLMEPPRSVPADLALDALDERSGTCYDPMVVGHLRALLAGGPAAALESDHQVLAVNELSPGMVLAEDLYTDSGFKLLTRGTVLTQGSLETLMRRHRVEPLHAVAVVRSKRGNDTAAA